MRKVIGPMVGGGTAVDYYDLKGKWLARVRSRDESTWIAHTALAGELGYYENQEQAEMFTELVLHGF